MRIYKKSYISKGYTAGGEWMTKDSDGKFREYIGTITAYMKIPFGCEILSSENERTKRLYPFQKNKAALVYDEIKAKYRPDFIEPTMYTHILTAKEKEKNNYSCYFSYNLVDTGLLEVSKTTYKRIKGSSSPYAKIYVPIELKFKLSNFDADYNLAILHAGSLKIPTIPGQRKFRDFVDPFRFIVNPIVSTSTPEFRPDIKLPK